MTGQGLMPAGQHIGTERQRETQRCPPAAGCGPRPARPALRQRFEGSYEGSWIESWRQESHRQSTPGAARKGKSMYIGIGTIVLIIIIVLVVLMLRRR
jgi:hypothetical protein